MDLEAGLLGRTKEESHDTASPPADSLGLPYNLRANRRTKAQQTPDQTLKNLNEDSDSTSEHQADKSDCISESDYENTESTGANGKSEAKRANSTKSAKTANPKPRGRPKKPAKAPDYTKYSTQDLCELLVKRDQQTLKASENLKQLAMEKTTNRREIKDLKQQATETVRIVKGMTEKTADMQKIIDRYNSDHDRYFKPRVTNDTDLTGKFSPIFANTKAFAAEWASSNFDGTSLSVLRETFARLTRDISKPLITERLLADLPAEKKISAVILNALLNRLVCDEVFARPFLHLDFLPDRRRNESLEAAISELMQRAERSEFCTCWLSASH